MCLRMLLLLFMIYRTVLKAGIGLIYLMLINCTGDRHDMAQWPQNNCIVIKKLTNDACSIYMTCTSIEASAAFSHVPYSYRQPTDMLLFCSELSIVMHQNRKKERLLRDQVCRLYVVIVGCLTWLSASNSLRGKRRCGGRRSKFFSAAQSCRQK